MKRLFSILLACFGIPTLLIVSYAQNSDLPFESGSTGEDGVLSFGEVGLGGNSFAFAYDAANQRSVRASGIRTKSSFSIVSTTQAWNGRGWSTISGAVVNANGAGLTGSAMAYDSARERLVMFGGYDPGQPQVGNGGYRNYTRELEGTTWVDKSSSGIAARRHHAMAYDAKNGVVVVFGGFNGSELGDTRLWDGTSWSNPGPANSPSPRSKHMMAYDSVREEVVLFGGTTGAAETWVWDGADWTQRMPVTSPSGRNAGAMCFDSVREEVVLFGGSSGSSQTWTWDGTNWTEEDPVTVPAGRRDHGMVFDTVRGVAVMMGKNGSATNDPVGLETWEWDGTDWTQRAGLSFEFDLTSDDDAIWHFTDIDIDNDVTVTFKKNAANTGVVWLASGNVSIRGVLDLDGQEVSELSRRNGTSGGPAIGGPGGFDGGLGGRTSGTLPTDGGGPGGGSAAAGSGDGGSASHTGTYGTAFGIPLVGGSGGGGGGAGSVDGYKGGSGGGAIFIASSGDITVSGSILARSGARGTGSSGDGGHGSGGLIRLVGDRIIAPSGTLDATSASPSATRDGRIRIEGYVRQFTASRMKGSFSEGAPVEGDLLSQVAGRLLITDVAGESVSFPPGGNPLNPDVIFGSDAVVEITVEARNIPDGTDVTLTIEHDSEGTIQVPAVTLNGGEAVFSRVVPAGAGTIQAFATYQVGGAP